MAQIPEQGTGAACLGALALLGAVLFREPLLRLILEWPTNRMGASGSLSMAGLARSLFFQIRPLLDLVYPPVYPVALNLLLWLLLALAMPVAAVVVWRRGDVRERLAVVLAFSWLVGSPLGFAVTRGFLPAQFFTLLCLVLALQRGGRGRRLWAPLLWGCLVAISRHTLNALSVERCARPHLAAGAHLQIVTIPAG